MARVVWSALSTNHSSESKLQQSIGWSVYLISQSLVPRQSPSSCSSSVACFGLRACTVVDHPSKSARTVEWAALRPTASHDWRGQVHVHVQLDIAAGDICLPALLVDFASIIRLCTNILASTLSGSPVFFPAEVRRTHLSSDPICQLHHHIVHTGRVHLDTFSTTATMAQQSSSEHGKARHTSMHDSARGSPEPHVAALDGFHSLVKDINEVLGPSSGIDSAEIDVDELKSLMASYQSDSAEWTKYAFEDQTRAYTRNLVDDCNGKSNLVSRVVKKSSWFMRKARAHHGHHSNGSLSSLL